MGRPAKAFEAYVEAEPNSGCMLWIGGRNPDGYGIYWDQAQQRQRPAHDYAYERAHGPVPAGQELDHACRIRACVNEDHVHPVTHAENMHRAHRTTASCGHLLTDAEVGKRRCRECRREYQREYHRTYRRSATQ